MPEVRTGKESCVNRVGAIISPFLKKLGVDEAVRLERIRGEWPDIFNEPLSLHMCPVSLKNSELLINVDSSVWLQQLSFLKQEIIGKLTAYGVANVRFRLGKATAAPPRKAPGSQGAKTPDVPIDKDTLQYIIETVSEIHDDELRESIRKSMEKTFSKKKMAK